MQYVHGGFMPSEHMVNWKKDMWFWVINIGVVAVVVCVSSYGSAYRMIKSYVCR